MGMVASEEYVRTSRQIVFTIQKAVNKAIVCGMDQVYFEDEAIDRLCKTAESSGANPNRIKKRHTVMGHLTGKHCLGGVFPTLEVMPDDFFLVGENDDDELTLAATIQEQKAKGEMSEGKTTKFFVTIFRRTGFKRLHLTGCFVNPPIAQKLGFWMKRLMRTLTQCAGLANARCWLRMERTTRRIPVPQRRHRPQS